MLKTNRLSICSNGAVQDEEAEVAPAVVAEKGKVAEESEHEPDIDSLSVEEEPAFEKVETAQPAETPAEPEPEPQAGKNFWLASFPLPCLKKNRYYI